MFRPSISPLRCWLNCGLALMDSTPTPHMTALMDAAALGVRSASVDVAASGSPSESMSDPLSAVLEIAECCAPARAFGISTSRRLVVARGPAVAVHAMLLDELGVAIEMPTVIRPVLRGTHCSPTCHFPEWNALKRCSISSLRTRRLTWTGAGPMAGGAGTTGPPEQLARYQRGALESIGDGPMPGNL